jgi:hypothetical protein
VKTLAELRGDLVDFVALIDLDGLVGGVEHDLAVLASSRVSANFLTQLRAKLVIEVVG